MHRPLSLHLSVRLSLHLSLRLPVYLRRILDWHWSHLDRDRSSASGGHEDSYKLVGLWRHDVLQLTAGDSGDVVIAVG